MQTEFQAVLRTTAAVQGQESHQFSFHLDRVARCTTVIDVLRGLLKQAVCRVRDEAK
jgi:hypothetical protein